MRASPCPQNALWRSCISSFPLKYVKNHKATEKKQTGLFMALCSKFSDKLTPSSCQVSSLAATPSTCSLLCTRLLLAGSQRRFQVFAACWPGHMLVASYQAPAALFTCWHHAAFRMPWIPCWVAVGILSLSSPFYISFLNAWLHFHISIPHTHTHTHTGIFSVPLPAFSLPMNLLE